MVTSLEPATAVNLPVSPVEYAVIALLKDCPAIVELAGSDILSVCNMSANDIQGVGAS